MSKHFVKNTGTAEINWQFFSDAEAVATAAAQRIVWEVNRKPDLVMCLPTGRTPLLTYSKLVELYRAGKVSFAQAHILNVDEYVGLGAGDVGSFADYMEKNLFCHIDIARENRHIPNGRAVNHEAEARRYDELIKSLGGIDFMVLGVGANGHVGFNEPGSYPDNTTHVASLSAETIATNRPDLPVDFQPEKAITIGLKTILDAHGILLLAAGVSKARPLEQLLGNGSVAEWPVAILRQRKNVTVFVDRDATP